ncbi:MAG: hypothetical protein C5B46_05790 [Proteobacteria bacterium]|nr:MAG: hypothetical protein C5B46_05790 [Pseudomonadota bacterium]
MSVPWISVPLIRCMVWCALRATAMFGVVVLLAVVTATGEAAQPPAPQAVPGKDCLDQFRSGRSVWVECYGAFETDETAQAELSNRTFDLVRNAKCGGTMRVQRTALNQAIANDATLDLDPQDILCVITMSGDATPEVTITLAPKITFQGKRAVDVSPRVMKISSLPELLVAPLRSGAESQFVRKQLTKELNRLLEQAFPK